MPRDYDDDEVHARRLARLEREDTPTERHRLAQPRGRLRRDGVDVTADVIAGSCEVSDTPTPDPPDFALKRVMAKD